MSHTALVVLSGGQDSTTCAFWARQFFDTIHAVTFDYGQLHIREIDAARKIAELARVASHEVVRVGPILAGTSPLTNPGEKLEQYANWKSLPGGLEKTFVPGRNILFLTLAANRAYVLGAEALVTGICQEDSGGYPDCREAFRAAMQRSISLGLDREVRILAPLMHLTKAESVQMAASVPGCWEALAYSHTSYDGAYPPVGHDHATLLRAKGFEQAGYADPLVVRAWHERLMELPDTRNYDYVRRVEVR